MDDTNLTNNDIKDPLNAALLRKTELEIEGLEFNNTRGGRLLRVIPAVSGLIAVAGFLFGVCTFLIQESARNREMQTEIRRDNDLREKEFKKRFWEKQLEIYSDLSQSAARLATLEPGTERDKEYQRLRELYHGNAIMVIDDQVATELKTFIEMYIDYQEDPKIQVEVEGQSRILAKACRDSLRETWDVRLKDLDLSKY